MRSVLLYKLFDWVFSGATDETPYKWTLDEVVPRKTRPFVANITPSTSSRISDELKEYKAKAEESIDEGLEVLSSDGWVLEKRIGSDYVYSKNIPNYGKVFKFVGTINLPAERLNHKLFGDVEKSPKWNCMVKKAKVLQSIDKTVNIAHVISNGASLVSSRDFVSLRSWRKTGDAFVHSSISVTHPDMPETTQYVRADQGFCTYLMKPLPNEKNKCQLEWLMHTNLKGWLPQYVIDKALWFAMINHVTSIRSLEPKGKVSRTSSP